MNAVASNPREKNAAFYLRVAAFFSVLGAIGAAIVYAVFIYDPRVDLNPGNPLGHPMTARERVAEQAPYREARQARRELADQVVAGDISFEEAGCEYRHGEWNSDSQVCVISLKPGTAK